LSHIHHSSIIEDGASIGTGTSVSRYCFIGKDVVIGQDNTIESHCVITGDTTIGNGNIIASHSVLGTAPQDIKPTSDSVCLHIGDENHIGQYVLISSGTDSGGGITNIGDQNKLMDRAHIGHDVQMGSDCSMHTDSALGGHVEVDDGVDFGESSAVHQFVAVGESARLEPMSALTQDLPPYCVAEGNRAKVIGLNIDERFSSTQKDSISSAYSILFESAASPIQSAKNALDDSDSTEAEKLYRFIIGSSRGIPLKRKIDVN